MVKIPKKILLIFIVALIILQSPLVSLANGSPYWGSQVLQTGNIEMVKKKDISLDKEDLSIKFDGDFVNVKVTYMLTNHGNADKIDYGFPVDYVLEENDGEDISSFKIYDDTKQLPITEKKSLELITVICKDMEYSDNDSDSLINIKANRKWFLTQVNFKEKETKRLVVEYRVSTDYFDYGSSVSIQSQYSDRQFLYDLSPSGNWGNGIVKELKITIDFCENLKNGAIMKRIIYDNFVHKNGVYTLEKRNFNLNNSEGLIVLYNNSASYMTNELKPYLIKRKDVKSIKASSVLKNYFSADKLLDGSLNSTWAEGKKGLGKGEYIDIELKNVKLNLVGIINGYTRNKELYYANARVKKIKVTLETIDAGFIEKTVDLPDRLYNDLNKQFYVPFMDKLCGGGEFNPTVKRIRLTILDTYKGQKYEDTCISEVFLYGGYL